MIQNLKLDFRWEDLKVDKHNRKAIEDCKDWTEQIIYGESDKQGFYIHGKKPGTGKTTLALCIASQLRDYTKGVLCLRTVDIPRNDQDLVMKISDPKEYPVLILDDFGTEKLTERMFEILFLIVDGRKIRYAPTVFTSNFDLNGLRKRMFRDSDDDKVMADRLVSRLFEFCKLVELGGPDRRLGNK